MELQFTARFKKDYKKLPSVIQKRTDEKLKTLSNNFLYPSLRVKKIKGSKDIFEASITMNYRVLFQIDFNALIFLRVGLRDILNKV